MRTIKGRPHNFPASVQNEFFGRVVTTHRSNDSHSALLDTDSKELPYLIISDNLSREISAPTIHTAGYVDLNSGDILQIFPSGRCLVVYQVATDDNALFFTDGCNSRCIMCPQPPKSTPFCFSNDTERIVRLIADSPKVLGITGGEPTIFWEDFLRLIDRIRAKLPEVFLQILTNARILRYEEKAKQLVEATGENAVFCIPIYSDDEKTHNELVGRKSFWQTIEGLYNLGNEHANIEIRNVILRQNYERLNEYGHFIYRNIPFATHIAIMGMEPVGLARSNFDRLWVSPLSYVSLLESTVLQLHRQGMFTSIYNIPCCILPNSLWKFSEPSISTWKIRYFQECEKCTIRNNCGGVFSSAKKALKPYITPILEVK